MTVEQMGAVIERWVSEQAPLAGVETQVVGGWPGQESLTVVLISVPPPEGCPRGLCTDICFVPGEAVLPEGELKELLRFRWSAAMSAMWSLAYENGRAVLAGAADE